MTNSPSDASSGAALAAPDEFGTQWPQRLLLPSGRVMPESCAWALPYSPAGKEAIDLAEYGGVQFDPWQRLALSSMLWERDDGRWAAFETGLLMARQNGKGEVLLGRELYGLFLARDPLIIHSAHEFRTADEAFLRIAHVVKHTPWFAKRVHRYHESHGEEGIELLPDATIITGASSKEVRPSRAPRLRFIARSTGAGRGFTADTVVWDEAYNLAVAAVNAQMPTLSAVPNPQLIYASSAVDQTIHNHGHVLARVRYRALAAMLAQTIAGPDIDRADFDRMLLTTHEPGMWDHESEPRLCWLEWQGDEQRWYDLLERNARRAMKAFVAERAQWRDANPALGHRLTTEKTENEWRAMRPRTFAVERLNIGDWPEVDDEDTFFDLERWNDIADPASRPVGKIALSIEVTPDHKWACIASAGVRDDGRNHSKIVDHRKGTGWLVERVVDLIDAYDVCAVVIDPASAAGSLIEPLKKAGVRVKIKGTAGRHLHVVTARDVAHACQSYYDAVDPDHDTLRHCGQENLNDAVADITTRPLADGWAFSRKEGGDVTPIMAAALALHGFSLYGRSTAIPFASRGGVTDGRA